MIRFLCPQCDKKLSADDSKAGGVGTCPACQARFEIPEAPPPVEEDAAPPEDNAGAYTAEHPNDNAAGPSDEPADEDRVPRRRRRRRRRRESSGGVGSALAGVDIFWWIVLGISAVCLLLLLPSFLFAPLAILPGAIGWLMAMIGGFWILYVAFSDDSTQGILCLLVPLYGLIYVLNNFEETKRPLVLQVAGTIIMVLAICAGGIAGG